MQAKSVENTYLKFTQESPKIKFMIGQDNNQFFLYDGVKDELVLSIDPDGNVTVTIGATCPFLSNNPDAKPICKTIKSVKAIRKGE